MSLVVSNLGKQTATEDFLVKKMALLHSKRKKLQEKKLEEERQEKEIKAKPVTLSKSDTILAAKRILQAEAAKKAERERSKTAGFKRSCKFERNRASRKEIKARPLSLDDSPERPSPSSKADEPKKKASDPDKEFVPNLTYFDHDGAGGDPTKPPISSVLNKSGKGKYSNFVSSNSKRKIVQYDDALDNI